MANKRQERADLHGHGSARKLVRPLTPREVAEFRYRGVPDPCARRRRAGIEDFRRALNDRFGSDYAEVTNHG
jgi:hypothetical protein